MKQSLQLKIGQTLTMTPQLQQAIRLLQLSSLELSTEVHEALESNMMLEADEETPAESADTPAEASVAEKPDASETELDRTAEEIPEDLPVDTDWSDIYDSMPISAPKAPGDGDEFDYDSVRSASETLRDHLMWQLEMGHFSATDREIAVAIIDDVRADGYLESSCEEIAQIVNARREEPVELDEVEAVLKLVQSFSPTGVAARSLKECLLLQLAELDPETPWLAEARRVVGEHLEALGAHDYATLLRRTKLKTEELAQIIGLIQSLNPKPGAEFAPDDTEYVVPDVYVRKDKGVWKVDLNPDAVPKIRINQSYAGMIKRADNSPDNNSLKTHLQEAKWFIKSLASRNETLLKVASAIVERQRAFLEHGEEAMKPLVLHDIADTLGLHESTVSRVTTRKYLHTPRGIFELKYFFSSHVSTSMGGEASSTAIRAVIKKLIAAETPTKPLSDSKISKLLEEQGINVARRTVAKYRESMSIPPSNERKRLC
mgnify:CR=1 FL=1